MPKVFQEEINRKNYSLTGYEKFDSLYKLYEILQNPTYFFVNILFDTNENLTLSEIENYIQQISQKYASFLWVVRCEKKKEKAPKEARSFPDIRIQENLNKIALYIQENLNCGYACILHEVIKGKYPSNRLDWVYSFGIYYQNNLPYIEIYPATDAGSIKWGKLSPIYLIRINENFKEEFVKNTKNIPHYQEFKLQEWTEKFTNELGNKSEYSDKENLKTILHKNHHYIYNLDIVKKNIFETKKELIRIAFKYLEYAHEKNTPIEHTILYGSLLFNKRLIIWDISSDKRWLFLK